MTVELISSDVHLRIDGECQTYRLSIHTGDRGEPRVRIEMIYGEVPESGLTDSRVMDILGVFSKMMFESAEAAIKEVV